MSQLPILVFFTNRRTIAPPIFQQTDVGTSVWKRMEVWKHAQTHSLITSYPLVSHLRLFLVLFCSWWWCLFGKGSPVIQARLDTTILCSSPLTVQCTTICFPSLSVIILTKITLRLPCDKMHLSTLISMLCRAGNTQGPSFLEIRFSWFSNATLWFPCAPLATLSQSPV